MNTPIVSRAYMRSLGREAFEAGESRDAHHMNWHAPAIPDWQAGWDEAAAEAKQCEKAAA